MEPVIGILGWETGAGEGFGLQGSPLLARVETDASASELDLAETLTRASGSRLGGLVQLGRWPEWQGIGAGTAELQLYKFCAGKDLDFGLGRVGWSGSGVGEKGG
jgi:hypothetical protein